MSTVKGVTTAIIHVAFWDVGLLGASGLVFMFIILSSLSHSRSGEIPISFILMVILYLGNVIHASFANDSISQFAHIAGGIAGGIYGLLDR
jgi:rhomboid protease GluP